jgi:hypothetical protein
MILGAKFFTVLYIILNECAAVLLSEHSGSFGVFPMMASYPGIVQLIFDNT